MLPTQVDLPPGNGRGIHIFQLEPRTGELKACGLFESGTSPSCLVLSADGTRLYSTNETERLDDSREGSVSAFAIERKTGALKLLNTLPSGGAGPTYASLHLSGRFLLVANYFGGSVAVFPIAADGSLQPASDIKRDEGELGPRKPLDGPRGSFAFSGHDRTHAHMIKADPAGKFVLHVDLGMDKIFIWKFDRDRGLLSANEPACVSFPPGSGPRHFAFHPNGKWLYSLQEESSTIMTFDYDEQKGQLTLKDRTPNLPAGFAGSSFASEILVSTDGRHVYAGNRLHDSIAIFSVQADGRLKYLGEEWTRGNYPRSFTFTPDGEFLLCCNQRTDNVTTFRVNKRSGRLQFTGQYTPVGNPSCITFLATGD